MARCKHYVEEFDCCAKTSEWVDGLLCTGFCYYRDAVFGEPNCRYFEEKADFVEVKHGKWLKGDMPTYGGYKCSVCRENTVHYKAKFCPECGADMRKEGADNG